MVENPTFQISFVTSCVLCFSVPSILRNSRYRRDQRQLDEDEELWFNEEDDFDDGEAVVPGPESELLAKKLDSELNCTLGESHLC